MKLFEVVTSIKVTETHYIAAASWVEARALAVQYTGCIIGGQDEQEEADGYWTGAGHHEHHDSATVDSVQVLDPRKRTPFSAGLLAYLDKHTPKQEPAQVASVQDELLDALAKAERFVEFAADEASREAGEDEFAHEADEVLVALRAAIAKAEQGKGS